MCSLRTLWLGYGDDSWLASNDVAAGVVVLAESGELCDARWSSAPSSVVVMGVGVSVTGSSVCAVGGLESEDDNSDAGGACGGDGLDCCVEGSGAGVALVLLVTVGESMGSSVEAMRESSGGHVARPALLSCSAGGDPITSSGVGMIQ